MSTSLRQRMTPQKITTSHDAQQQQQQQYEMTSMHSPTSYQQQFASSTSVSVVNNDTIAAPLSIPATVNHSSEQYNHYSDTSPYRFTNATSSTAYVRSNSSSMSIDDGKGSFTCNTSDSDDSQNRWKQRALLIIGLLCLVTPWMRHSRVQWDVQKLKDELVELQNDQQRLQTRLRTQNDAYTKITSDITKYQSRNNELLQQLREHGDHYYDFDTEHYKEQSEKEDAYLKRIDILEKEVKRMADRQLVARGYGTAFRRSDTIQVEIILKQDVSVYGNKLVMELGPMSFLSHAIELFLMLVEHKHYYDNLMLMHRSIGSSIISTIPMDSETLQLVSSNVMKDGHPVIGSVDDKNTPFEGSRENTFMMDQLAMLEHTEDFPIQKYSVLFADKGPHFYIQMDDVPKKRNEKQPQETCFGRIVEGQAILEYMSSHHTKNFRGMYMVGIETIKVIQPLGSNDSNNVVLGIDPRLQPVSEVTM